MNEFMIFACLWVAFHATMTGWMLVLIRRMRVSHGKALKKMEARIVSVEKHLSEPDLVTYEDPRIHPPGESPDEDMDVEQAMTHFRIPFDNPQFETLPEDDDS